MKNGIKHIFFDLDNTLWDHRGNSETTLRQMFKDYEVSEKYDLGFDEWHDVFYENNEVLWAKLRDKEIGKEELRNRRFYEPFVHFGIDNKELSQKFEDNYLIRMGKMRGVVEGANELLEYLYPKYKIHVITNGFEEVSQDKLTNSGLIKYVETLTGADEIGLRKPDPKLFDFAAKKANAPIEETLIIGDDWLADVLGGVDFGWKAIFFDSLNEGYEKEGVAVVEKLIEIKELL